MRLYSSYRFDIIMEFCENYTLGAFTVGKAYPSPSSMYSSSFKRKLSSFWSMPSNNQKKWYCHLDDALNPTNRKLNWKTAIHQEFNFSPFEEVLEWKVPYLFLLSLIFSTFWFLPSNLTFFKFNWPIINFLTQSNMNTFKSMFYIC